MSEVTITMRLYGAFRKYQDQAVFAVPAGSEIKTVQEKLIAALGPQSRDLVLDSVIANDTTILPADYVIEGNSTLSILPPVCGG